MIGYSTTQQLSDMSPVFLIAVFSYWVSSNLMLQVLDIHELFLILLGSFFFLSTFLGSNFLLKTDALKETLSMGKKLIIERV